MAYEKRLRTDDGFGLVEVVVSMMILMVVFLAFGALLLQSLTSVVSNGTRATAAQLATERIEQLRVAATTGDCSVVETVATTPASIEDGRGVLLTVSGYLHTDDPMRLCEQPADDRHGHPRLTRVTVEVVSSQSSGTKVENTLTTDIWVKPVT